MLLIKNAHVKTVIGKDIENDDPIRVIGVSAHTTVIDGRIVYSAK